MVEGPGLYVFIHFTGRKMHMQLIAAMVRQNAFWKFLFKSQRLITFKAEGKQEEEKKPRLW